MSEYLRRPSLEYQHAFDLCAAELERRGGPCVLHASSPFYARELMKRIEALHPAEVVCRATRQQVDELPLQLGPEVEAAQIWNVTAPDPEAPHEILAQTAGIAGLGMPGGPAAVAAIWAEPEKQGNDRTLHTFEQYLAPGGRLCVVTSGPLRRILPEWNGLAVPLARDPAGLRLTLSWLRRGGFAAEAVYGIHGPRSLLWGTLSRIPAALGRGDLVDRCFAAMRRDYLVRGWQARWAPVAVVLARRHGNHG